MKYLHKHNVVIRRIKLESILLAENNQISELRLTDLFLFNYVDNLEGEGPTTLEDAFMPPKTSFQGERRYQHKYSHFMSAPELLPRQNYLKENRRYYDQQVDIWTLGCLIFNMVTCVPPWYNDILKHDSEVYEKIRESEWRPRFD